jgi:AraC-like DNA-binding protein
VQQVARAVGYESVSSFIAAFKVRFGITPARYRNAVAAGE